MVRERVRPHRDFRGELQSARLVHRKDLVSKVSFGVNDISKWIMHSLQLLVFDIDEERNVTAVLRSGAGGAIGALAIHHLCSEHLTSPEGAQVRTVAIGGHATQSGAV